MRKTRYAIVGTGSRAGMYIHALMDEFKDYGELTAFCDINKIRMNYWNEEIKKHYKVSSVPCYKPADFKKMIKDNSVDVVIITSIDRTHHRYIISAMEMGCNVITEKPMTIDEKKCRLIFNAIGKNKQNLKVAFNYRYSPRNSKIKELLMAESIGKVISVHFEWLLDTIHGADYFRRWHRDKHNSGGLIVHKATHHFDLVNWWLNSVPETVFGIGALAFYGRENAEERGIDKFYDRGTGNSISADDPFALSLTEPNLKRMYLDAEKEDGYHRDQSVFSDGISIEDDMALVVRYENEVSMTYHLTAYSPWEGYRVAFNGTRGRLEYEVHENSYISGAMSKNKTLKRKNNDPMTGKSVKIILRPLWGIPKEITVTEGSEGGHGGGDSRLLHDIFVPSKKDPLRKSADHIAGAMSILVGIAANKSFASGLPVRIKDIFDLNI